MSFLQVLWFPLLEAMMAAQKQVKGLDSNQTFEGTHTIGSQELESIWLYRLY